MYFVIRKPFARVWLLALAALASVVVAVELPGALLSHAPTRSEATLNDCVPASCVSCMPACRMERSTAAAIDAPSAGTPASNAPNLPRFESWLRGLLISFLIVILGKLLLLQRFAAPALARIDRNRISLQGLLPHQIKDLGEICGIASSAPLDRPGQVVQLVGRWGEGKSYLLHYLRAYLSEKGPPDQEIAVVVADVWKHETEPHLHLAIMEELLGERHYLLRFGWLHYPLSLLAGRYLSEVVSKLTLLFKRGEVELKMPKLTWQPTFERLVRRQQARRVRTFIVLDEIDRATPQMVQVALTLTRRSLDLPSVTIMLAYVEEMVHYKAFNPLLDEPNCLPDLQSTGHALMFQQYFSGLEAYMGNETAVASENQPPTRLRGSIESPSRGSIEWLRREYIASSPYARRRLQNLIAEKYLGRRRVQVTRPALEAFVAIPFKPDLLAKSKSLIGPSWSEDTERSYTAASLEEVRRWAESRQQPFEAPPLRVLMGTMDEVLYNTSLDGFFTTPQRWAALMLWILQYAVGRYFEEV